ncbi:MAG TPA: sigma-70 family RNA polymerase sigma factor [Verrucomicrobiales bacterium]|nr:sigma-70 family RNA polymerase sigma factor [Verrucomicrobiales bacterium]
MTATKFQRDELIPTRHSLITRLKNWEDQEGWKEFFDTYWKLIYQVALKAGLTESEACDVVQETVVAVAKSLKDFKTGSEHGSFKGWLLQITRWRIADQFRKRPPEQERAIHRAPGDTARTGTMERIADPAGPELEAVWDREWNKNLMDVALERLKAKVNLKHYQLFYLHVVRQMPARRVAKTLGVSVGSVYVVKLRLSRMLKRIFEQMKAQSMEF